MPTGNRGTGQDLRKRAEKIARKKDIRPSDDIRAMTPEAMMKMLQELQVHQIELELQNEELRITQLGYENARERYFDLYNLAPIGYCTISEKRLIHETNLSAATLLGVPRSLLNGKPISKFILNDDQDIFYLRWKKLLKTGKPQSFELRMKKDDGTLFWVWLEAVAVPSLSRPSVKDPDPMKVFRIMLSDITISKKAEEVLKRDRTTLEKLVRESSHELIEMQKELERSQRLYDIGALAATVAHELRNPLFGISLATAVIGTKTSDYMIGDQLQMIEKMLAESSQIIDNLLFYSKLRKPNLKALDLHSLLEECIDSVQTKHIEKGIHFSKRIDSLKGVPFMADPVQFKEVFINVLNNSLDAVSDEGGEIDVKAGVYRKSIRIYITDNGSEISNGDLKKVFDPFFSTKEKGTGLGLTVCAQIVKMHRGSISIKSGKGKGTSVIIALPKSTSGRRKTPYKINQFYR